MKDYKISNIHKFFEGFVLDEKERWYPEHLDELWNTLQKFPGVYSYKAPGFVEVLEFLPGVWSIREKWRIGRREDGSVFVYDGTANLERIGGAKAAAAFVQELLETEKFWESPQVYLFEFPKDPGYNIGVAATTISRGQCIVFGGGRKYAYGKIVGYNPATKTLTVAANPDCMGIVIGKGGRNVKEAIKEFHGLVEKIKVIPADEKLIEKESYLRIKK